MIATTLLALLPLGYAHICMWQPPQREGAFEIQEPGESVCYLKEGPCGSVPSGEPQYRLKGGQNFNILFQQNLNHFYVGDPGTLVADIAEVADPTEEDFYELGKPINDFNAMNEITQTNFTLPVNIPNIDCEHCVIRMRYVSKNPTENDRGTTFYQCADVSISKEAEPQPEDDEVMADDDRADLECCAPSQFVMRGYETSSWRNPTSLTFYFDAVNQLFRVDSDSGSGKTTYDGNFQMYSNFTSGIEYYFNVNTNECDLYGLNLFSNWCYGSVNNQKYQQTVKVGSELADVWYVPDNIFTWTASRANCVPLSKSRADNGELTMYYNMIAGEPNMKVHELPQACKSSYQRLMEAVGFDEGSMVKGLVKSPRVNHGEF